MPATRLSTSIELEASARRRRKACFEYLIIPIVVFDAGREALPKRRLQCGPTTRAQRRRR